MKKILLFVLAIALVAVPIAACAPAVPSTISGTVAGVNESAVLVDANGSEYTFALPATVPIAGGPIESFDKITITYTGELTNPQIMSVAVFKVEPTPTPEPTAQPDPEPTFIPGPVNKFEGTVLFFDNNEIELITPQSRSASSGMTDNWKSISFFGTLDQWDSVTVGDDVTVEYTGDINETPMIQTVTVTKVNTAQFDMIVTVFSVEAQFNYKKEGVTYFTGGIMAMIPNGNSYAFEIDSALTQFPDGTRYANIAKGQTYQIKYLGDLNFLPVISSMSLVVTPTPAPTHDPLVDKKLGGTVTAYSKGRSLQIQTAKGNYYSFRITGETNIDGKYRLEEGVYVNVVYDGYASNMPDAKKITTTAPIPPSPVLRKMSGTMSDISGIYFVFTNGANGAQYNVDFNSSHCDIQGEPYEDGNCDIYYYRENGTNPIVATKVVMGRLQLQIKDSD